MALHHADLDHGRQPAPLVYVYTARLPEQREQPRPLWPERAAANLRGLPDVVDLTLDERAVAVRVSTRGAVITEEVRRMVLELITRSVDAAAAETARLALVAELRSMVAGTGTVILTRVLVDGAQVIRPPEPR